ncbi:hypothetical protein AC93_5642 [Escherichia coli 2-005-03_S4_C2]|nr:hypothetical protein AD23_3292 [Escherichia coli 2-005-03_S4_C3]EZJ55492.1 hypothetical protein AC93_5642 [Escherichia coli 2-005-03_S4_C2]KDT26184.1 hypothetical protein AC67_3296 [Escherichia coli 2-052-05_S4_C1]
MNSFVKLFTGVFTCSPFCLIFERRAGEQGEQLVNTFTKSVHPLTS